MDLDESARVGKTDISRWLVWLGLFVIAFGWRLLLLSNADAVYSWDAFLRVVHHSRWFVSHWLPLPQLPLLVGYELGLSTTAIQSIYAAAAALGVCATAWAATVFYNLRFGVLVGLGLAFMATHAAYSIVPYQETMFIGFAAAAVGCWQRGAMLDSSRWRWLAAALLIGAQSCRYEGWLLALVLFVGQLFRRRFESLRYFALSLFAPLMVLAAKLLIDIPADPTGSPLDGTLVKGVTGSWDPMTNLVDPLVASLDRLAQELTWPGLGLAVVGLVAGLKEKKGSLREIAVFGSILVLGAVTRGISFSTSTSRMVLLSSWIMLPFLLAGLLWLLRRPGWRPLAVSVIAAAALLVLGTTWALDATHQVSSTGAQFRDDASLADSLAQLPAESTVLLSPKWTPLEHGVGAVFAQTTRLDPDDGRWLFGDQRIGDAKQAPDYFAYWSREGYKVIPLSAEQQRVFLDDPLSFGTTLAGKEPASAEE